METIIFYVLKVSNIYCPLISWNISFNVSTNISFKFILFPNIILHSFNTLQFPCQYCQFCHKCHYQLILENLDYFGRHRQPVFQTLTTASCSSLYFNPFPKSGEQPGSDESTIGFCFCGIRLEQESPPAWTQEAYRPPCRKYSLCCFVSGGWYPHPVWWGGGCPHP